MASITTHASGRRMIQFTGPDRKRKTIRLGEVSEAAAELVAVHVENLARSKREGLAVEPNTARWLARLEGALLDKLAKAGLVEGRLPTTVGEFTRAYIDSRNDMSPRSKVNLEQARKYLLEYFEKRGEKPGPKPLAAVSEGDADAYRRWLREQVGENTTRGHCRRAKHFFRAACRKRLIDVNPFGDMKELTIGASSEFFFVPQADAAKVLKACPDAQWRLLFALSRYGGLRCPSEHRMLTWGDINWEAGTMLVRSPKTVRHDGKESRIVPIFAELLPYLEAAWDEAPEGAEFVITIPGIRKNRYANVGTRLTKIIERAGVMPWPDLTHNLRKTRETELAATFPEHVVCTWLGNSKAVARKHYLHVTDEDVARAVAEGAASGAAGALRNALHSPGCRTLPDAATPASGSGGQRVAANSIPPRGFEPLLPD